MASINSCDASLNIYNGPRPKEKWRKKKKKVMNSVLHTDGFKIRNIPAIVTKLTKPFELLCFACMELIFPTIHVGVIMVLL